MVCKFSVFLKRTNSILRLNELSFIFSYINCSFLICIFNFYGIYCYSAKQVSNLNFFQIENHITPPPHLFQTEYKLPQSSWKTSSPKLLKFKINIPLQKKKISETKSWFFKKGSQNCQTLSQANQERWKIQINKIRNKRGEVANDAVEMKRS